jgi:rhodanese-related sulfurtransferase
MKPLAIILAALLPLTSCSQGETKTDDRPPAVARWIKATPDAQILDVRTKEEFATGHLANARLIPWTDADFAERAAKELDPSKPLLVYCRSGARSAKASTALSKLGFKSIRNLDGGITAWTKDGQPVVKPT